MPHEQRTLIRTITTDRKWLRLARLRNGSLIGFLVSLVGTVSLFAAGSPLKGVLESAALVLGFCWPGSIVCAFLFQALLERQVRRTLESRDVIGMSGWIDLVLGPGGIATNGRRSHQCQAEARGALLEQLPLITAENRIDRGS
jgi:hypothetical protein